MFKGKQDGMFEIEINTRVATMKTAHCIAGEETTTGNSAWVQPADQDSPQFVDVGSGLTVESMEIRSADHQVARNPTPVRS